jgi:hypothetical protein
VFQDITGGTLVFEKSIFLLSFVTETEEKLDWSGIHLPDLRERITDQLGRSGDLTCLQENNVNPSVANVGSSFQDLLFLELEDGILLGIVAAHRAKLTIYPAQVGNLDQSTHDHSPAKYFFSGGACRRKELFLWLPSNSEPKP